MVASWELPSVTLLNFLILMESLKLPKSDHLIVNEEDTKEGLGSLKVALISNQIPFGSILQKWVPNHSYAHYSKKKMCSG